jgi:hypothetical protein
VRAKRPSETKEPIPFELIVEYLMLPEKLPGVKVDCYRYDDQPRLHWIHFHVLYKSRLWQYVICYDQDEPELARYRDDILNLRWYSAVQDMRESLPYIE